MNEFKWQRLLERKCPRCGEEMSLKDTGKKIWMNCNKTECMFGISVDRIIEKMKDPNHPIMKYASPDVARDAREAYERAMN